jgi:hypothetical protein
MKSIRPHADGAPADVLRLAKAAPVPKPKPDISIGLAWRLDAKTRGQASLRPLFSRRSWPW